MRDVSGELVPVGDDAVPEAQHVGLLDALAALCATTWGWRDELGLLPHRLRWEWFGPSQLAGEAMLGYPERVPEIAVEGWERFAARVPAATLELIDALRADAEPLSTAVRATPQCFIHGDWKFSNLGTAPDGRTVLLDWAYPGEGPACHELVWYLALNRSRLPVGHSKETTIGEFRRGPRASRRRHRRAGGNASSACACSAGWCCSVGRRRGATTRSCTGGATSPPKGPAGCDVGEGSGPGASVTVMAFPGHAMNRLRSCWLLTRWRSLARNLSRVQP